MADDQSFIVVECPEFQILMNLCNPEVCLPSSDTVRSDILKLFKEYQEIIQKKLQVSKSTNKHLTHLINLN